MLESWIVLKRVKIRFTLHREHTLLLLEMSVDDVREVTVVYFDNHVGYVD